MIFSIIVLYFQVKKTILKFIILHCNYFDFLALRTNFSIIQLIFTFRKLLTWNMFMQRVKPWTCRGGVPLFFWPKGYPYYFGQRGTPIFLAKGVPLFFGKRVALFLAKGIIQTPSINRIPLINQTLSIKWTTPYFLKKL